MMTDELKRESSSDKPNFNTTQWSMVLAAARGNQEDAAIALQSLCRTYWYPLFAFARRRGFELAAAQDATQEFFKALLDKDFLKGITREGGRFRSFLLTAFRRFLANHQRAENTIKRGGGRLTFSLAFEEAETKYQNEPSHNITAEQLFEHRWAVTLIERVMNTLKENYREMDKMDLFTHLHSCLTDQEEISYREIADRTNTTEGAVKSAAHRLRIQFANELRREIGNTVENPDEIEEELQALIRTLQRGS